MVSQSNQFFNIATNECFFLRTAPLMKLLLSHSCLMFVFVFFSVNQLNRLMFLRKLGTSVQCLIGLLVFFDTLHNTCGTSHIVLSISTLKNIYCCHTCLP